MELCYTCFDQAVQTLECSCAHGEPMSRHTTFQIGGPADRFVTVETLAQLKGLLKALKEGNLPYLILGKGSNLLVSDKGIRGVVLLLAGELKRIELLPGGMIRAGAAASLASVCSFAREHSLSGLEFAWGIPGSVGGAAYMDAGAYGGEMRDVVERVCHLTPEGEEGSATGEDLQFDYRKSRYTGGRDVITFVEYRLHQGDPAQIAAQMEELMSRRKSKQPYDMPSAGSVFKRPQGGYAAALIEECGLKGRRVGGAQVSEKHTGFIVNTGGATCRDVLSLIGEIQKEVYEKRGIRLEPEVRMTGEE